MGADVVEMLSRAALLAVLLLAISVDSAKLKVKVFIRGQPEKWGQKIVVPATWQDFVAKSRERLELPVDRFPVIRFYDNEDFEMQNIEEMDNNQHVFIDTSGQDVPPPLKQEQRHIFPNPILATRSRKVRAVAPQLSSLQLSSSSSRCNHQPSSSRSNRWVVFRRTPSSSSALSTQAVPPVGPPPARTGVHSSSLCQSRFLTTASFVSSRLNCTRMTTRKMWREFSASTTVSATPSAPSCSRHSSSVARLLWATSSQVASTSARIR